MIQYLAQWDGKIFLWINGYTGSWLDYVFAWTTLLGTPLLFILVLIFMLIWDQDRVLKKFFIILAGGAAGGLTGSLLKMLIGRERPYSIFYEDIAQGKVIVNTFFDTYFLNSFPSGHAALVFATVVALNMVYKNKLLFLYPLAGLVAFSRVYVGAHFPSDIAAGAFVGALVCLLSVRSLLKRYLKDEPNLHTMDA